MSILTELRRPFHGGHLVLLDLATGTQVATRRARAWVLAPLSAAPTPAKTSKKTAKGDGDEETAAAKRAVAAKAAVAAARKRCWERLGGVAAGVAVVFWEVNRYPAVGVPLLITGWGVVALVHAPPRAARPAPVDHGPQAGGQPGAATARFILGAVQDATAAGFKGVHIADLVSQLQAKGLSARWDVTALREWCEANEFPVRRNLKLRGRGNSWGIHIEDLERKLPMPLSQVLAVLDGAPDPEPPGAPTEATLGAVSAPASGPAPAPPLAADRAPTPGPVDAEASGHLPA
jgi:hypothetical protein